MDVERHVVGRQVVSQDKAIVRVSKVLQVDCNLAMVLSAATYLPRMAEEVPCDCPRRVMSDCFALFSTRRGIDGVWRCFTTQCRRNAGLPYGHWGIGASMVR